MKQIAALPFLLWPASVLAQDTQTLGAHEHGHSALNIAVEGNRLMMELEAPGTDIVGFEYKPTSDADRASVTAALATLSAPLELFGLPDAANCTVVSAQAALHHEGEHGDHGSDSEHKDHAEHEHSGEHGDHAEHDHKDHEERAAEADSGGHTEFHAEYRIECTDMAALDEMSFAFFERFPNAEEVDVQLVSDAGAKRFEVARKTPVLDLRGAL